MFGRYQLFIPNKMVGMPKFISASLELGLESLSERRLFHRLLFFYTITNGLAPAYLKNFVPGVILNLHNVRGHNQSINQYIFVIIIIQEVAK